jgi:DNA-binding LacI/PurR family transcriptional regulator
MATYVWTFPGERSQNLKPLNMQQHDNAQRVSLKDLARHLDLSIGTVSMALRNHGRVARATRERVHTAAEKMGYRPNVLLASLASRRFSEQSVNAGTPLALIQWNPAGHLYDGGRALDASDHYRSQIPISLEPLARRHGFSVQTHSARTPSALRACLDQCYRQGVLGIMLTENVGGELPVDVGWERFSVLATGPASDDVPFDRVQFDHFHGTHEAYTRFAGMGFMRIGAVIMHHLPVISDDRERIGGILTAQRFHESDTVIPPLLCNFEAYGRFRSWLREYQPDALVGLTARSRWWLHTAWPSRSGKTGYIQMLTAGDHFLGDRTTGFQEDFEALSLELLRRIEQMIRRGERGIPQRPNRILVPLTWVEGDSHLRQRGPAKSTPRKTPRKHKTARKHGATRKPQPSSGKNSS